VGQSRHFLLSGGTYGCTRRVYLHLALTLTQEYHQPMHAGAVVVALWGKRDLRLLWGKAGAAGEALKDTAFPLGSIS
jgi:hypothetical protein